MKIKFWKYQGTGNDFIIVDNRTNFFPKDNTAMISFLCQRKFGIGADGLILYENSTETDFNMIYYNADGNLSSMCGNGGRCICAFSSKMGVHKNNLAFSAADGKHDAVVVSTDNKEQSSFISLKMGDVSNIEIGPDFFVLDTGSPHYVKFVQNLSSMNVYEKAREIRYSERYKEQGINVNFVEFSNGNLFIRTYERGVENETLSCGTGMTAAALCASVKGLLGNYTYCRVQSFGGETSVRFKKTSDNLFHDIWLEGPASYVFEGEIDYNFQ